MAIDYRISIFAAPERTMRERMRRASIIRSIRSATSMRRSTYEDKEPHKWYGTTRSNLIGRNPVLDPIFGWFEKQGERVILKKEAPGLREVPGLMTDLEPQQVSEQLWSFLNLDTVGTSLRESFLNVPK